jgi:uncharacterized membrane protein YdfJ with MMPL/SSD domain
VTRLGRFVDRRRRWVLAAWLLLLLAALPLSLRQQDELRLGGFISQGSQSDTVGDQLRDSFPSVPRNQLRVLLVGGEDSAPSDFRAAAAAAERAVAGRPNVTLRTRGAAGARRVGDRRVAVLALEIQASYAKSLDISNELRTRFEGGAVGAGPVRAQLVGRTVYGAAAQGLSRSGLAKAEAIGFPLVLAILLAVFGSLAAATLPVAMAITSVVITGAVIFLLAQVTTMSVFVSSVASMVGIGVAVDYSLFMLARYREELLGGASQSEARATMLATSGRTVAFSGVTVVVALASLWVIDNQGIRSVALGAITVVTVSVVTAVALLPVLVRSLGDRAVRPGRIRSLTGMVRAALARRGRPDSAGFWSRWARTVMAHPVAAITGSLAILLVLSLPLLAIELGDDSLRQIPADNEVRQGAALLQRTGEAGAGSPVLVTVRFRRPPGRPDLGGVAARLRAQREVKRIEGPTVGRDGRTVLIAATLAHDPESPQAKDVVRRLRAGALGQEGLAGRATVAVGGPTATAIDLVGLVSDNVWKLVALILVLSYLVLVVVLRSLLLPLKAVVLTMLSLAASYGVLVAVFQWGWLDPLLGSESLGHVQAISVPVVLAVVFGLSMDYEIFLLRRIRERYEATGDSERAVAEGLERSAPVISSAALIMVTVFSVFVLTSLPGVKQIGLGNAVAIALDATLVRLVLVPASMRVLGRWNWWLPSPIERLLGGRRGRAASAGARA